MKNLLVMKERKCKWRHVCRKTCSCLLILLPFLFCFSAGAKEKPTIILIYTDQQRYNTIHALGNEQIQTPNLDRLAKSGVAFTHAFVASPVCCPSRWSLHSGMYPSAHQTYSNHHVSKKKPLTSLPLELKKNGYTTILLGKNHSFLNRDHIDILEKELHNKNNSEDGRSAQKASPWTVKDDATVLTTNRAISLLEEQKEKPVFMWLSYLYPHTPFLCPEPYFSMYDTVPVPSPVKEKKGLAKANKPFRQQFHQLNTDRLLPYDSIKIARMKRTYYGMISLVDVQVGRILAYLERTNRLDNTILVFSSDHGDYMGDHGLMTKSPSLYDCLTRVPLIFSYPDHIEGGRKCNSLVSSTDIMPTLLDFASVKVPVQVQGHSLLPELKGEESEVVRQYVFAEYGIPGALILEKEVKEKLPDVEQHPIDFKKGIPWEANPVALSGRIRMIRSENYKLVQEKGGTHELYDLNKDPYELENLYGKRKVKEVQLELEAALEEWVLEQPIQDEDVAPLGQKNLDQYIKKRQKSKNGNESASAHFK